MKSRTIIKTIKCKEEPEPAELAKQLEVLAKRLPDIYAAPKNMSIKLARKQANNVMRDQRMDT